MNNLSIALYAIDVVGNLNALLGFVAVFTGAILLFALIGMGISCDRSTKTDVTVNDSARKAVKTLLPFFIIATSIGIFIPDKRTVRLIVASEFSEAIYKSEDVQEVLNPAKAALKKWLNDYTKEVK